MTPPPVDGGRTLPIRAVVPDADATPESSPATGAQLEAAQDAAAEPAAAECPATRWQPGPPPFVDPARRALARAVAHYAIGRVPVRALYPDGRVVGARAAGADVVLPVLEVLEPESFFARLAGDPKVGLGESYTAGEWRAAPGTDLAQALEPFARDLPQLVPAPLRRVRAAAARRPSVLRGLARNTRERSRADIEAHYDLSGDLFAAFLDPSLTYSSALFTPDELASDEPDASDLAAAQVRKIDAVLDLAGVGPGTRLLEIGSGWGSLALAAGRRGARVVTITLSADQHETTRRRLAAAGLADRVSVELRDYRDVEGRYDAVVSVEMIEAVGQADWPTYLRAIERSLAPGGRAVVQSITMAHERLLATSHSRGWIQKHIFPGGLIPSIRALCDVAAADTGLSMRVDRAFGAHYARTLRCWRGRFVEARGQVLGLGFDEAFVRAWEFYLAYCEAGFAAGYLDVHHLLLTREAT